MYINGEYRASSYTDIIKTLIPDLRGFENFVLAMEGGFLVNDNGKPKVNEKTFHYDVSNRMKKDMDENTILSNLHLVQRRGPLSTERKRTLVQDTTAIFA